VVEKGICSKARMREFEDGAASILLSFNPIHKTLKLSSVSFTWDL